MPRIVTITAFLTAYSAITGLASQANAGVIGVTSPAGINLSDSINWAQLGPTGISVASPSPVTTAKGASATVGDPQGPLLRLDQASGFEGNFNDGDALLYTGPNTGPINVSFAAPVAMAGVQIQRSLLGQFAATISAYDMTHTLLGSFTETGFSDSSDDGSAIFIGLLDNSTSDIASISLSTGGSVFAINGVTIGVPEPASFAVFLPGVLGFALTVMFASRRRSP